MILNRLIQVLATLACLACVLAQTQAAPDLAEDPLRLDKAGLLLRVPIGATAQTRTLANREVTTIALPDALGTLILQPRQLSQEDAASTAPDDEARDFIAAILQLPAPDRFNPHRDRPSTTAGRFIGPGPRLTTPAGPTRPLYAQVPPSSGTTDILRGVAILATAPNRRVVIELLASSDRATEARETFEAVLATAVPRQEQAAARTNEIQRRTSAALLAGIDQADFKALLGAAEPRFERLYEPGRSDLEATERGYRRTVASTGFRGDVTGTPKANWSPAEAQPGYLVALDARLLGESGERVDSRARYFLSENRREETWSITMSVRTEGPTTVWTETGARVGRDLTVNVSQGRAGRKSLRPTIRVEGFLSRVESLLLPKLLAAAAEPGEYTFAAFDSQRETVTERTEALSRTDTGWTLTTTYDDGRTQTMQLTPTGAAVRTTLDSGLVWETIEFERLYRLWQSKGLPLN